MSANDNLPRPLLIATRGLASQLPHLPHFHIAPSRNSSISGVMLRYLANPPRLNRRQLTGLPPPISNHPPGSHQRILSVSGRGKGRELGGTIRCAAPPPRSGFRSSVKNEKA